MNPTIMYSNYHGVFNDSDKYDASIKLMLWFQKKHILFGQFDAFTDVILISIMFKCVFSAYRPEEQHDQVKFQLTNDSTESLTKNKFIPAINLRQLAIIEFKPPSNDKVFRVLYRMGY